MYNDNLVVVVTGGRYFGSPHAVSRTLSGLNPSAVFHGDATGADSFAKEWAISNDIPRVQFDADLDKHGKAAVPIRNGLMLRAAICAAGGNLDRVILVSFSGGAGTADCVEQANALGILHRFSPVRVLALDIAKRCGVAVYSDGLLSRSYVFDSTAKYARLLSSSGDVIKKVPLSEQLILLSEILKDLSIDYVVAEDGFEGSAKNHRGVGSRLAMRRGRYLGIAEYHGIPWSLIQISEWRRIIRELGIVRAWPAGREKVKAASVRAVGNTWDMSVDDDQAEAILIGHAFLNSGGMA